MHLVLLTIFILAVVWYLYTKSIDYTGNLVAYNGIGDSRLKNEFNDLKKEFEDLNSRLAPWTHDKEVRIDRLTRDLDNLIADYASRFNLK